MRSLWIVAIGITLGGAMPLAAQTHVGARGGWSSATVSGGDLQDPERRSGVLTTLYLDHQITRWITFEVAAGYTQKGVSTNTESGRVSVDLGYVETPVSARVVWPTEAAARPYAIVGVAPSWKATCAASVTPPLGPFETDCEDRIFEGDLDLAGFDVGLLVGAGVAVDASAQLRISAELGWTIGLREIDPDPVAVNKNRALWATVGLGYRVGG